MNYDPNMVYSGRMTKQTVRLTFGQWEYRKVVEVTVGGNCQGLTVIRGALGSVYEDLPGAECPEIVLEKDGGENTLSCIDDEQRGEDWLADMLIAAEIIAIEPDEEATKRWRGGR